MIAPTPAEITTALNVLRRVPGLSDRITAALDDVEYINGPKYRMAVDLHGWWTKSNRGPVNLQIELHAAAARHGLCITTDPGELVGYAEVQPRPQDPGWYVAHAGSWQPDERPERDDLNPGARVVALYLPHDGGQA